MSVALPYPAVRFPPSKMGALSAISVRESGSKEGSVEKLWGQYAKAITIEACFRWMQYSHQHKKISRCHIAVLWLTTPNLPPYLCPRVLWCIGVNETTSQQVNECHGVWQTNLPSLQGGAGGRLFHQPVGTCLRHVMGANLKTSTTCAHTP